MKMTPDQRKYRADTARRILEDPLFKAALERIENDAIEQLIRVPSWPRWGDRKRYRLAEKVNVIRSIRDELRSVIIDGEDAARRRPGVA